jgi:hypothetical protein
MAGAAADDEQVDIVELLEHSGLTDVDQRRMYNALVNNMIDGWTPDRQSILRLIEFAAGRIDDEEHMRQVLKSAGLATPARRQVDRMTLAGNRPCEAA